MTFSDLRNELSDRGFAYLSSTRLNRYINQSYLEICNYAPWPFLEVSLARTHAQTITDLGSVLSVYNATSKIELTGVDRDWIKQNVSNDLTTTGTATYWYLTGASPTFNVFPVDSTTSFTVYYLEVPDELSGDSDEPVVPDRFQDLIIDRAAIKAYKDSDNFDTAAALRAEYQQDLEQMASHYFARNLQNPEVINTISLHEDAGYYV